MQCISYGCCSLGCHRKKAMRPYYTDSIVERSSLTLTLLPKGRRCFIPKQLNPRVRDEFGLCLGSAWVGYCLRACVGEAEKVPFFFPRRFGEQGLFRRFSSGAIPAVSAHALV